MPTVSVIIPARNKDEANDCIESINWSKYRDFEIILVCEGKERSAQRNIGINRANGKYLLFLDADMGISEETIQKCVKLMDKYNAIYLPELIRKYNFWDKVRNFERWFYVGTKIDVVRFVRAHNVPCFNELMHGPEDWDWDRRVLGKRAVLDQYISHDDGPFSFKKYLQKKSYYAHSMEIFKIRWPGDPSLNFKYRYWTVLTERGKWKSLIQHPILAIGMMVFLTLKGIIYLCVKKS